MATIYKEFELNVGVEQAWDALRDFYKVHERLVPGFVTACTAEPGARLITFFNGQIARELLVGSNDELRRLCYASVGGRATHHQASAQVFSICRKLPLRVDHGRAARRTRAADYGDDGAGEYRDQAHARGALSERCSACSRSVRGFRASLAS